MGLAALAAGCALIPTRTTCPLPPEGRRGPSYTALGRTYHTLSTADGYVEDGLASWYGPEFHGRYTSSGEPYDMHGLTAAHKTLPLQTWVKVRNQVNGREVVVRVNDRGPFVDGRIIDLSLGAAQALGMACDGVVPCRVEALGFRTAQGFVRPRSYDLGEFTIQVGAFRELANARRLCDQLSPLGRAAVYAASEGGERLYKVRVARYQSLEEALRWQEEFRRRGFAGAFAVAADQPR